LPPDLLQARSVLFVPADRPERFDKAVASGADMIILDLEDAVAPDARTGARNAASAWLTEGGQAILRVNAPGTPWAAEDETLADLPGVVAANRGIACAAGGKKQCSEPRLRYEENHWA
jgi:hypothetical protein